MVAEKLNDRYIPSSCFYARALGDHHAAEHGWGLRVVKRKKLVRVHLKDNGPSLEGFLTRLPGRYVLKRPKVLEGESATVSLEGDVEIPSRNVQFWQTIDTQNG